VPIPLDLTDRISQTYVGRHILRKVV